MKNLVIVMLVCVNVALLGVLMLGLAPQPAKAQVVGGGTNYVMHTAKISDNYDAVYVIDLRSRKMLAFRIDKTSKKLTPYTGVDLVRDFRPRR